MKPSSENSRRSRWSRASRPSRQSGNHPITDWSFQADAPSLRGESTPFHPGTQHASLGPGFHTLSQGFFPVEANWESRVEGVLFGLMVAIAAWPIALALHTALVLIK